MNDAPDELERAVLGAARRGLSPTGADQVRVRSAVGMALDAGAASPDESAVPPAFEPAAAPFGSAIAKLAALLAVAAGTAAAGYHYGYEAGRRNVTETRSAVAVATVTASAASRPSEGVAPAAPQAEPRAADVAKVLRSRPAPSSPPSASVEDPKLQEETRLLTRVERALRDDNPRLALGLLGELDRAVPGGQFVEERHAARVMGHCELGTETAGKLFAAFAARYPASAYLGRARETCAPFLTQRSATGATDPPSRGD